MDGKVEKLGPKSTPLAPAEARKDLVREGKVKQKAAEVISTAESVEDQEGIESGDRVSEAMSEDKKSGPQTSGGKKSYSQDEIEAIRAKLLAALPPQEVMIKQIRKKLVKNEKVLTKKMRSLQRNSHMEAYQLNIVVAQLRRVREYFAMLAHATYEMIKHLWLKIVHGV